MRSRANCISALLSKLHRKHCCVFHQQAIDSLMYFCLGYLIYSKGAPRTVARSSVSVDAPYQVRSDNNGQSIPEFVPHRCYANRMFFHRLFDPSYRRVSRTLCHLWSFAPSLSSRPPDGLQHLHTFAYSSEGL